jgi:hypothetical protein
MLGNDDPPQLAPQRRPRDAVAGIFQHHSLAQPPRSWGGRARTDARPAACRGQSPRAGRAKPPRPSF